MNAEQIKRLRELYGVATRGPWEVVSDGNGDCAVEGANGATVCDDVPYYPHPVSESDMRLIAAMHEALPGLLDEVERLREAMAGEGPPSFSARYFKRKWESAEARLAELEGRVRDAQHGESQ